MATTKPTKYTGSQSAMRKVNASTCELISPAERAKAKPKEAQFEKERQEGDWRYVKLILFNMIVSTSFIASYTPSSFYLGIVLLAGTYARPVFIYGTWKGWIYEITHPDPIIKLIEACYIFRHEENLVGEEEAYCMLREILRQPELVKGLSGSALKGSLAPSLDKLNDAQKTKLKHLEKLEQKGFDVGGLKEKIVRGKRTIDDSSTYNDF